MCGIKWFIFLCILLVLKLNLFVEVIISKCLLVNKGCKGKFFCCKLKLNVLLILMIWLNYVFNCVGML